MKKVWYGRRKWLWVAICVSLGLFAQLTHSYEAEVEQPVALACDRLIKSNRLVAALPDSHYLFSERYGWFDTAHFETGQPGKVLRDVETAVKNGGGVITIRQGVRDNVTGYTAAYQLSGRLQKTDVVAAALGIYLDWSIRFEAWQAAPPRGLVGPLTPFAVEDLPSQYLGFVSQAKKLSLETLFACYLGPVAGLEDGPPDLILSSEPDHIGEWGGIMRLQNKTFTPLVPTQAGWQRVDWPKPLRLQAMHSSPASWQFLSETTWYFGKINADLPLSTPFHRSPRSQLSH